MTDIRDTRKRWIRVCVDMFDHPALQSKEFDNRSAFAWLIANAAWKDHKVRMGNQMVVLKRGQVLAGRSHLASVWGWGEKRVRLFLDLLVSENMIEKGQSRGRFANVVTICNYDKYQSPEDATGPVDGPVEGRLRAGSGPHSIQGYNNTNYYTATREREDVDLNDLSTRLIEACNGALADPCNAQGLLILTEPLRWLEQGCDLEKDVLPTLRAVGQRQHGKRISSWSYFTDAVVAAKARRESPLPEPSPHRQPPTPTAGRMSQLEAMAIVLGEGNA